MDHSDPGKGEQAWLSHRRTTSHPISPTMDIVAKLVKRQGYGRAKVDLLRKRLLHAA